MTVVEILAIAIFGVCTFGLMGFFGYLFILDTKGKL
jgi:hypothetical protein